MKAWLTVIIPIILGTIAISFNNVVRRYVMKSRAISPLQGLILYYAAAAGLFGVVYIFFWGLTLPQLLPGIWTAVICGVAVNIFIQFFKMKASSLDEGEVSLTAPLQALTPGLIIGLALLLGEYPSKVGVLGIGLMVLGTYVLLWEKTPQHWYEYFGPLKRIIGLFRKDLTLAERNKNLAVMLSLGSAGLGTIGLIFDGLYSRRSINIQGLIFSAGVFVGLLCLIYLAWYLLRSATQPAQRFRSISRRAIFGLLAMGVLWVMQVVTIYPTFAKTFIAYTGTLKRFSILISVVLGYFLFHEQDIKKRLWAAIIILAGVILISLDDLPARLSAYFR